MRKNIPTFHYSTVTYNRETSLFVHVQFDTDRKKPYSKNNFGVLYYELVSSPFMISKNYLDILGNVILNQCDKYFLAALFKGENENICRSHTTCSIRDCSPMKKRRIKQKVYLFAVKLIKPLAISTCQTINSDAIQEFCYTCNLFVHYHDPCQTIKERRG